MLLIFYRQVSIPAIFISLLGCLFIIIADNPWFTIAVFWMKITTNTFLGLYLYFFQNQNFYFFHNLGFRTRNLFTAAFAIDFFIWIVITFFILLFV